MMVRCMCRCDDDDDDDDGLIMYVMIQMHNRVVADAFLPAGGRPNTIDVTNYRQFLKPGEE